MGATAMSVVAGTLVSSLVSKKPKTEAAPPAPATQDGEQEAGEAANRRRRRGAQGGRSGMITTSPSGATMGATYQGSTLLGG